MKSLLIIDTPKNCGDCPCIHDELWMCQADKEYREGEYSSIPSWCPLKPMPEKVVVDMSESHEAYYQIGWNECLEELEK